MPNEELSNKDTTPHDGSNEDKIKEPHDNVGTNSSDHTENESKPNAVSSKINEAPSSLDSEVLKDIQDLKKRVKVLEADTHSIDTSDSGQPNPPGSPPPTGNDPRKAYRPRVDYLIQYIASDRSYNDHEEVFHTEAGEEPDSSTPHKFGETKFAIEVFRRIKVSNSRKFTGLEKRPTLLRINSHYLAHALETVVDDPTSSATLQKDPIEIEEPYQLIFYCIEKLRCYQEDHPNEVDLDITVDHINLLLDFITKTLGVELSEEKQLNSQEQPLVTWKWLWTIFPPGRTICTSDSQQRAYVITSISGGNLPSIIRRGSTTGLVRRNCYNIDCWALEFTGRHYERVKKRIRIDRFSGVKMMTLLLAYPLDLLGVEDKSLTLKQLSERGKRVYEVHKASPCHFEYNGRTRDLQSREIQSRVVIDHECYRQERRTRRPHRYPDIDYYSSDSSDSSDSPEVSETLANYDMIPKTGDLTDHQLSLLSNQLYGWILKDRKWALLDVKFVADIIPDKQIFESLILPEDRTEIIKALVQSHKRRNPTAGMAQDRDQIDTNYSADSIRGKGQGLLILLHGPPGVGKTSTAECVAEYTGRPLFPITCGDLGTDPKTLEDSLQNSFYLAQRWGAVLLLDEADVFLQRRELEDLQRNSLVSVFLRVLEYYTGILFLTTNRVGIFDEAFTSRLHVSIHYPRLEEKERRQIWKYHVRRVEQVRQDLDVRESVSDYVENSKELKKIAFNGRQIRNIFQTAVSLAFYEARCTNKRPSLRSEHLKKVVNLSREFQEYLESTRESDSMKARDGELRNDEFKGLKAKKRREYEEE